MEVLTDKEIAFANALFSEDKAKMEYIKLKEKSEQTDKWREFIKLVLKWIFIGIVSLSASAPTLAKLLELF